VNVGEVNAALLAGEVDRLGVLPRLDALREAAAVFTVGFGLETLPAQPGVLIIRGARQFGKSTWLEGAIRDTVHQYGHGTALFLDGDHLRDADHLAAEVSRLSRAFDKAAPVRRLFIDEVSAISGWEKALKRVLDRGELKKVLVVTTGSQACDLRHGTERLPGRKGKLDRTAYLFLPVSYREFARLAGATFGKQTLAAYLVSGGSPLACAELLNCRRLPEWVVETVRDWILGECARTGRPRRSLVAVMQQLHLHGGTALGQTKLAREAGLANNTVAAGWIGLLRDLLCVGVAPAYDASRRAEVPRRPAKFPFINLLAAGAWSPEAPRSPEEFAAMPPGRQGLWYEWAVAQELFRRAALRGDAEPERVPFWQSARNEVDFVPANGPLIEVKRGRASPLEFDWFHRAFPQHRLTVVCSTPFETDRICGVTLKDFLLDDGD
jgi:predicted AAA+ superfamily ATPase